MRRHNHNHMEFKDTQALSFYSNFTFPYPICKKALEFMKFILVHSKTKVMAQGSNITFRDWDH
jgi:hypothetical protein